MVSQLKITRRFNADVASVYDAWTKPELFIKWMGPGPVTCVKFDSDLQVGGQYEIHMQTDEGIKIAYGEYKEIIRNEKLSFTWGWRDSELKDSLVSIVFSASGSGTQLVLEHNNLPTQESAEHHTQGWNASLDKLENFVNITE